MGCMAKKKTIILVTIILIVLILIIGAILLSNIEIIEEEGEFITLRLYDKDGNILGGGITQSIVQGVSDVVDVDLTITVTNTGTEALTCDITSLTNLADSGATASFVPTAFDSAVVKDTRNVPATIPKKASWTSAKISVAQFEADIQPIRFDATVECSYNPGSGPIILPTQSGYIDVTILPESGASGFSVEVSEGGLPSEFCGDGTCQIDEDSVSCPEDCAVSANVNFRTSDLSYPSGSAIAYNSGACGNVLVAYGYESETNQFDTCISEVGVLFGAELMNGVKGDLGGIGSDNIILYSDISDTNEIWLCQDGSPGRKGRYDKTDLDAGNVDTTPTAFDPLKEMPC